MPMLPAAEHALNGGDVDGPPLCPPAGWGRLLPPPHPHSQVMALFLFYQSRRAVRGQSPPALLAAHHCKSTDLEQGVNDILSLNAPTLVLPGSLTLY